MTLVRIAEAAVLMGLAERTVRAHIRPHKGRPPRLPAVRDGRDWYVDTEDIAAFELRPAGRPTETEREQRAARDETYRRKRTEAHVHRYGEKVAHELYGESEKVADEPHGES